MSAVFSITASESASLSFNLPRSLNACLKFLSEDSCAWLLLSHVLRRSIVLFMDADSGFPVTSLFACPIMVASPMSCIASEVGEPVLLLSSYSSFENERHSGPESSTRSVITKPHPPQNLSPVVLSVSMEFFPQRAHLIPVLKVCKTMNT